MVLDCDIAKQILGGSTKIAKLIKHGLSPSFHNKLLKILDKSATFANCFDEVINKNSKEKGTLTIY